MQEEATEKINDFFICQKIVRKKTKK